MREIGKYLTEAAFDELRKVHGAAYVQQLRDMLAVLANPPNGRAPTATESHWAPPRAPQRKTNAA